MYITIISISTLLFYFYVLRKIVREFPRELVTQQNEDYPILRTGDGGGDWDGFFVAGAGMEVVNPPRTQRQSQK